MSSVLFVLRKFMKCIVHFSIRFRIYYLFSPKVLQWQIRWSRWTLVLISSQSKRSQRRDLLTVLTRELSAMHHVIVDNLTLMWVYCTNYSRWIRAKLVLCLPIRFFQLNSLRIDCGVHRFSTSERVVTFNLTHPTTTAANAELGVTYFIITICSSLLLSMRIIIIKCCLWYKKYEDHKCHGKLFNINEISSALNHVKHVGWMVSSSTSVY